MDVHRIKVTELFALDAADVRMTADGYMAATPRVGRIGIQLYRGSELGRPEKDVVRVWRPEAEVMSKDAMRSLTHKPVTNNHPREAVTADNWKKYSVGQTGDTVARDGEFIRVPMALMDGETIKDVNGGKKELSLGYTSNIEWRSGVTDTGEEYDAVQTTIRINHLAVVDTARGGPKLAIGDVTTFHPLSVADAKKGIADKTIKVEKEAAAPVGLADGVKVQTLDTEGKYVYAFDNTVYRSALVSIKAEAGTNQHPNIVKDADELLTLIDTNLEKSKMTDKLTSIVVDGINVEMSDLAASVVLRRVKGLETEAGDLRTKLEAAEKKIKKDSEESEEEKSKFKKKQEEDAATITTLQKQLGDAEVTPAKLDKMVADRALVVGKAKVVLGDKLVVDGKTLSEIRKQVVVATLGDAAVQGWSDDAVNASFATLTAKVTDKQAISAADAGAQVFSGQPPATLTDSDTRYDNYNKNIESAYKHPNGAPAARQ